MTFSLASQVAYPLITYRLHRVALWRQARIRGYLHPGTRGTGLFGVAWDKLLPLLFAFCFYISVCMGPKGYCLGNSLVYFPPSHRPNLPRSLTQLRKPSSPSKRESFYVVVRGVGLRDVSLRLFPTDTVGRIYAELRRIRVIPRHDTSIEPMVYYDAFQSSPLKRETTMQQLGIGELSVLHVRYRQLGGTGGSIWDVVGSQAQCARNSNSAGPSAPAVPSHFPSIHLDRWIPASSKPGQWRCLVCDNGKLFRFDDITIDAQ
ncbi:hypothetical protein M422DRAFT_256594 [Sphaerobolus stellatus SS14]|uniref:Ubiquitin-like domain-containing protein n=1 Tax=Sphaerobolus stellatus (strain SS14) TaxID=990650 RepID=A0A0C9VGR5_SPHS4|nr:hypothetical protein M422DRAFT_256594 [Sphaerobolus stellatus SS14]